jgi:hypothetical protein
LLEPGPWLFFVEGQFDVGGFDDRVDTADGLGVEGVAGFVEQAQVSLGSFGPSPVFSHSLFTDSFLATSSMQWAGTPRVYQLWTFCGAVFQEFGESCRRDVRRFEERFESWAASVLFHKRESTGAGWGFE